MTEGYPMNIVLGYLAVYKIKPKSKAGCEVKVFCVCIIVLADVDVGKNNICFREADGVVYFCILTRRYFVRSPLVTSRTLSNEQIFLSRLE